MYARPALTRRGGVIVGKSSAEDGLYPMRVVTRLTGLSAHTIRVWERRYGAVVPERTSGNTRRYSAGDVRKLSLLKRATDLGYAIREVAALEPEALEELVERESEVDRSSEGPPGAAENAYQAIMDQYLTSIARFEYFRAHETISRAAALLAADEFIFRIVLPLMRETGERWERGEFTVAHEHAVTAQMRGLLDTLLRMNSPQAGVPQFLASTPEGHLHEFGALVASQMAAIRGYEPLYLGPNMPADDLVYAAEHSRATVILISVVRDMDDAEMRSFDEALRRLQEHIEVWVGMPPEHAARGRVEGVRYFDRFEDLDLALTERITAAEY